MSRFRSHILIVLALAAAGCAPVASRTPTQKRRDYSKVPAQVEGMLARIRAHAAALASFGPRQTGQEGCDKALEYIRSELVKATDDLKPEIEEFSSKVTVTLDRVRADQLSSADEPFSHVVLSIAGRAAQRLPAYALQANCVQPCATHPAGKCPLKTQGGSGPSCPNCEQPRRVVDLRSGSWAEFKGKDLDGAVVLLDFNSGEAWLRAAALGAQGAIFAEPDRTTLFQADAKYLATLPLHFPRMYLARAETQRLREALRQSAGELRLTMVSRLRFENVKAGGLALTIPGKRRDYSFVLAAHFDGRCIVPDLSYGAAEVWGPAELIELTRHFAKNQPGCDLRIIFVSGHWQNRQVMRQHISYDPKKAGYFERAGKYYRLAMGIDLVPEGRSVNLLSESAWDAPGPPLRYSWLRNRLFNKGGWRDEILEQLGLADEGVELFGGTRPTRSETGDDLMAARNDRCPLVYAPRYPTAEEPFQVLALPTFAFQTGRLARLAHNTPLDRFGTIDPKAVDHQLRPQMQITLAMLDSLIAYPVELMPESPPGRRSGRGWGGYAKIEGRIQRWDQRIGWFSERLPGEEKGAKQTLRTLVHTYPVDELFRTRIGTQLRNYLNWPMNPSRGQHRELQSFMFQDLLLLEHPHFNVRAIYSGQPETQYNVLAYSLDEAGRIRYATDFGVHGDSNKSFQCTDLNLDTWRMKVPVSMFECGTLELFDLIDPQRYDPAAEIRGAWLQTYLIHGDHAERGVAPHLRITGIKDVDSHTDIERWGFTQYGPTAMVFLPADHITGAEILLGAWHTNFAVLNDPDESGVARGYRVTSGQTRRLTRREESTPLACIRQLTSLNQRRMEEFAAHDVASPLAEGYHKDSVGAIDRGLQAQQKRDWESAQAHFSRGWIAESLAYRNTIALLLDVVSTTVLYFVLLIPFSFLVERLMFPQRTALRTALVAVVVFAVFAAILYLFHPGFKLAHNVVVTVTAFVIVVMTIPALILLLVRGVAMLRAIGSKAVITQRSEAEGAGVVIAALSLAVSNMRRRRLRTALTLVTITALVVALVLLTTSSAFDFKLFEPSGTSGASFEGFQIYNASDRRQPLLTEMVEVYEAALEDEALVIRRECVNYGYDHKSSNGTLFLEAKGERVRLPYFQVMDHRDDLIEYTLRVKSEPFDWLGMSWGMLRRSKPSSSGSTDADKLAGFVTDRLTEMTRQPPSERKVRLSDLIEGQFLAKGDVEVCLLPNTMAEELGVKVGETVSVMGLPLKVKGIWTAQTKRVQRDAKGKEKEVTIPGPLDQLTDLDGLPVTAMRSSMHRQGEPDNPLHAPSREIVIVPRAWISKYRVFPSCVYSLIVIPKDEQGRLDPSLMFADEGGSDGPPRLARPDRLAKEILNVDVFSRMLTKPEDPTQKPKELAQRISMQTATHVKGSKMMLVVLGAAVLMVLAIMTGTVYERMREIHIFSSVGLSPRHVAGMFLIEALVYAGIAAVLGYFLGIIALKGLLAYLKSTTGKPPSFYPNYLGVFVLYSIGMAVAATVASSLYPIRLASKIVNPSAGKGWQLDELSIDGPGTGAGPTDLWRIRLPFIATTWDEARAMMVYACDYLAIHQGERSGRFVCESPPLGAAAGDTMTLTMPIWLAPFERNLSQHSVVRAAPAEDAAWWVLSLDLTRISGPPYLWKRGATVFVNMLCKHLLRWRAATQQQEADCLARADETFPPST